MNKPAMSEKLGWFILICIPIPAIGLWVLLNPETFWQRCSTFAICVIVLVLIIYFVHIWRTKWKDSN